MGWKKNYQLRILYPEKLSFKSEGQMEFLDKQKQGIYYQQTCPVWHVTKRLFDGKDDDTGKKLESNKERAMGRNKSN